MRRRSPSAMRPRRATPRSARCALTELGLSAPDITHEVGGRMFDDDSTDAVVAQSRQLELVPQR